MELGKHEVILDRVFAEDTWELAFGDGAWENQYEDEDVYQKLREHERKARAWDAMYGDHSRGDEEDYAGEDFELLIKMDTYLGDFK